MPILAGDIKLVASQVMGDAPEGGGAPTAHAIADGASNALFPDISELDRAGGRVNLRKAFVAVQTDDTDRYLGANLIVAEPPADPRVSIALFTTGDTFDQRAAAQSRIEAYLAQGPAFAGYLFGNHLAGQMTVTLLARPEIALPVVGQTLVLRKLEGQPGEAEQFVRVTSVGSRERTFEDASGPFTRREITLDISDQLRVDFPGHAAIRFDAAIDFTGKTKTYETIVADAARYAGVVALTQAAPLGAFNVQAAGIFTQLVPSAQVETPIADARANQQAAALVAAGPPIARAITLAFTTSQALHLGGSILPGSLAIERDGLRLVDRGARLVNEATAAEVGAVDYANGTVALATNVFGPMGDTHAVTFTPAGAPMVVSDSLGIAVTAETQRLTYVATLAPAPARASLSVNYRAGGRWYVLTEDGSGAIRGADSAFGVGMLNYQTGTVTLTLGALPDVGTKVILAWSPQQYIPPTPPAALGGVGASIPAGTAAARLATGYSIAPGTLTVSWNDGAARSATDAGGTGTLSGDAAGHVDYLTGVVLLAPAALPPVGALVTVAFTRAARPQASHAVATLTDAGATWTATIPAPVHAGSVHLTVHAQHPQVEFPGVERVAALRLAITDNGAGALLAMGAQVGSIDYASGAITLSKQTTIRTRQPVYETFNLYQVAR